MAKIIERVGNLVHPAPLESRVGEDLLEHLPGPERSVTHGQFGRRGEPAAGLEIDEELSPSPCALGRVEGVELVGVAWALRVDAPALQRPGAGGLNSHRPTHRLTEKHPIRLTSTSWRQNRRRHNQGGNPLTKRPEPVQTNRATSYLGAVGGLSSPCSGRNCGHRDMWGAKFGHQRPLGRLLGQALTVYRTGEIQLQ